MGRWLVVTTLCTLLLASLAVAPPASAAEPDAAVGVWVQRTRPSDDLAGARVIVTAARARPSRQVLEGDGEGMAFGDLTFAKGAAWAQVVITPVAPAGMHLASGGCDRVAYDDVATGIAPYEYVIRDGHVVVTLTKGKAASCVFVMAPGGIPETDTALVAGPKPLPKELGEPLLLAGLLVGLVVGLRRFRLCHARGTGPVAG